MNDIYEKKPVRVRAFQMTKQRRADNSEWPDWLHDAWNKDVGEAGALLAADYPNSDGTDHLVIQTMEGTMTVGWGDWIIQGVKGELYPCKPDIFEETYRKVYPGEDKQEGQWLFIPTKQA